MKVSKEMYSILLKYTYNIEAVSCDEALLDISNYVENYKNHNLNDYENIMNIVNKIRNEIFIKTSCTCSAGIGINN